MENIEKQSKWEKLSKYLENKEYYEILLLDMLRANELKQEEYQEMIRKSEKAYREFLDNIKK